LTAKSSQTAEELNAKIEAELGLPHTEVKPNADTEQEADAGADGELDSDKPNDTGGSDEVKPTDPEDTKPEEAKPAPVISSDEDLFIEVEDADGNKVKLTSLADLPDDFQYKNSRQPLEIFSQLQEIKGKLDTRAATAAETARQEAETAAQNKQFEAWDREIASLGKEKRLDVKDQERIDKVFAHISEVNAARVKANNPNLITSFEDGLDKYEKVEAKALADDKLKQENERAKLKSSLLGGSSASAGGAYRPYVSGSARSMDDLVV
jgi:hypothetical protein